MNLTKNAPGTSQISERFGRKFAPGSFALQQSIRLVYMLRALSRGRNRATRAARDNQDAHTHRQSTRSAKETQHHSQPKTPKGSWPPLLPRRRRRPRRCCCCCCCCYCCCCCFTIRDASRSTSRLNRLFLVLCFFERTQDRVTAQQQQQQW